MNFHFSQRPAIFRGILALLLIISGPFGCSQTPPTIVESAAKTDPKVAEAEGRMGHTLGPPTKQKKRQPTKEEAMGL